LTAIIALPVLVLLVLYASAPVFNVLVLLAAFIGLLEFYRMTLPAGRSLERSLAITFGLLFAAHICLQKPHTAILVLCLGLLLLASLYLFRFRDLEKVFSQLSLTFFGLLYIPFLLAHLSLLRNLEHGREWVFFALVIAMAGDSAAYFVGSAIGRRKLYPEISPNKSVEGAVGGMLGSVVGAFVFKALFLPQIDNLAVLLIAVVLSALGQVGDLFESMLKR
ncbi:MAG: phosphatidate cytidylyltransferase, partial [Desulfuromonadales bacterium]|nr:phosphatidate cytidylyltransferase [Desulfuromonadales bacterium]NIS41826.1 phosphatidate cytidylyltransferase [Desulfuromonadales bacterium]